MCLSSSPSAVVVSFRMYRSAAAIVFACVALTTAAVPRRDGGHVDGHGGHGDGHVGGHGDGDGDDLLDAVLDRCAAGPGAVRCIRGNVLEFMRDGRSGRDADEDADEQLARATGEYIGRSVTEAGRATDDAPNAPAAGQQPTTTTTARADMEMGMMQDKMLMPLMMLMKMKLKMLMPIMMAVISMKATKALVISKVAIFLVLGFLVKEFLKKSGLPGLPLHLPGLPGHEPSTTAGPPPMYGPPQSSGYESSGSWEPTGYSGHSSDTAHSMAYNSYLPSSPSSSSSSSSGLSSSGLSANKY